MSKFYVGQKVRCVDAREGSQIVVGSEYEVSEYTDASQPRLLKLCGLPDESFYEWRFEPLETPPDDKDKRLADAAPELLSALRYMVEVGMECYDMECGPNGSVAIERAEAAIAKATGEERGA